MAENNINFFVEERQERIKNFIDKSKRVTVYDLTQYFKVSPSTIRNDLTVLESRGLIHRTHGGAIALNHAKVGAESFTAERLSDNIGKKESIALAAGEEIEDGDTIALLAGTTIMALAKTLVNKKKLTIVLNDLYIAKWLEENTDHSLYFLGGFIRKKFHFVNFEDAAIDNINVDKAFFSCTGFSLTKGATVSDINLANSQRKLLMKADRIVLLCDSSKFGEVAFAKILGVDEIDLIVTDADLTEHNLEALNALEHTRVKVAPK